MSTKWTLVTGGAKNLGAVICKTLAKNGHAVCLQYKTSKTEAEKVVAECRALGVEAELIQGSFDTSGSTVEFVERYKTHFKVTKNLINNVGHYVVKTIEDTELEEAQALFQTNFFAPYLLSKYLIDQIKIAKGVILNVGTSGLLGVRADCRSAVYTASKMALWSFTKSSAKELAPFGVRVNMVSPGRLEHSIDMPKNIDLLPMKRLGTFAEVARVCAFLLDDANGYITGQNIEIAGAISL